MNTTEDEDITRDGIHFRRAEMEDAVAIVALHRAAFRTALPHLPELHTPAEDLDFFIRVVARQEATTWLAVSSLAGEPMGFITFCPGAVEHLYVHPAHQGQGLGTALLRLAMRENTELKLWAFQRNSNARRFYEKHGFIADRMTEGMGNEEREPDMRYVWKQNGKART
jgi:GNAT superfamily N-acetyltransferase